MNTKQQTAVDWLLEQIENKNGEEFAAYYSEFIDQAKEKEKKQMKEAALQDVTKIPSFRKIFEEQFEKYYDKIYGGDK